MRDITVCKTIEVYSANIGMKFEIQVREINMRKKIEEGLVCKFLK